MRIVVIKSTISLTSEGPELKKDKMHHSFKIEWMKTVHDCNKAVLQWAAKIPVLKYQNVG